MSLASEAVSNPAINDLIQSSWDKLGWISYYQINDIKPTEIDNVYHTSRHGEMLLCLGNNEECTPTLVSEFARIYSLPTHEYDNDNNQFRRYYTWLNSRNNLI